MAHDGKQEARKEIDGVIRRSWLAGFGGWNFENIGDGSIKLTTSANQRQSYVYDCA